MSAEELYQALMALPEDERFDLIDRVWEASPEHQNEPPDLVFEGPGFAEEIERRLNDREGSVPLSDLYNEE